MREKMFKNKKGITLIALVITIIVMLILVAVTINMAVNGGLFEYAKRAGDQTELAKIEEELWAAYLEDVMADYANGTNNASIASVAAKLTKYNILPIPVGGISDIRLSNNSIILGTDDNTKTETITVTLVGEEDGTEYYAVVGGKYYKINKTAGQAIEGITIEKEPSNVDPSGSGNNGNTNELEVTIEDEDIAGYSIDENTNTITITITGTKTAGDTEFTVTYGNIEKQGTIVAKALQYRTLDGAMWLGSNVTAGTAITGVTTTNSNVAQVYQLADNTYALKCGSTEGTALVTITTASGTTNLKVESTAKTVYTGANTPINGDAGTSNPVVPTGFYAIDTLDAKWDLNSSTNNGVQADYNKGLVIMDARGNQFVWVPVPVIKTGDNADTLNETTQTVSIAEMKRTSWTLGASGGATTDLSTSTSYKEPYASGYQGEGTDYYNMMKSVYTYGGFYVGRYEAGTTSVRGSNPGGTTTLTIMQDVYPYNYVPWGTGMTNYTDTYTSGSNNYGNGAVYLSKNLFANSNATTYGVESTLIYGSQWDRMLKWVNDSTHVIWNSTSWGNYTNNTYTITRGAYNTSFTPVTTSYSKTSTTTSVLLTTGASDTFKAKNIYDIAGNVYEWTMEAKSSAYRVNRGGCYGNNGSDHPAASRNDISCSPTYISTYLGFRPALYIVGLGANSDNP